MGVSAGHAYTENQPLHGGGATPSPGAGAMTSAPWARSPPPDSSASSLELEGWAWERESGLLSETPPSDCEAPELPGPPTLLPGPLSF